MLMSKQEIKKTYDQLRNSGDLYEIFSSMTGLWERDEKNFTEQYNDIDSLLEGDFEDDTNDYEY